MASLASLVIPPGSSARRPSPSRSRTTTKGGPHQSPSPRLPPAVSGEVGLESKSNPSLNRAGSTGRLSQTLSLGSLTAVGALAAQPFLGKAGSTGRLPASPGGWSDAAAEEMEEKGLRLTEDGKRFRVGPRSRAEQGVARETAMMFIREMEDKKAVVHLEAFDNAIKAMHEFPTDLEVQTKGCFAMAYNSLTHSRKVLKAGGLEAVLAAMKTFPKEERLQLEACECLRYLTVRGDDMKRVMKAGGLEALFMAIRNNPKAVYLQQEATGALKNIAAREPQAVLGNGGLEQVNRIMDLCPKHSWMQMWGCQAMRNFAEFDARRVDNGAGFRRVDTAMQKHKRADTVQRAGIQALRLKPPS